ncbi:MAG: hypothetical protein ACKV1O_08975 [Saprospiraceae bacterium]
MRITFALFILSCCVMQGCNPQKLLEKGKPDRAFSVSISLLEQRLKQNKPLKEAHLHALSTSYGILQEEQIQRIETLETNRAPERHLELYPIYQELLKRRVEIDPYLPHFYNFDPRYDIPSLEALTDHSRQKAGSYCSGEAAKLFPEARSDNKPAARTAYSWLEKSLEYVPEALENKTLLAEMMDLGTIRVLVTPYKSNTTHAQILAQYALLHNGTERWNWLEVHFSQPGSRIDYLLHAEIAQVIVGFDERSSSTTNYCKEVIDGYKTVEKEVPSGDSTIIVKEEVPILITVHGSIESIEQYKSASASLYAQLTTPDGALSGDEWRISKTAAWSNRYEQCSGDSRALPHCCSGSSSMYPFDSDLLRDLASPLRGALLNDLAQIFADASAKPARKRKVSKKNQ